ncbi:hypothetical protein C8A00DRAFT_38451 [Chaetomidium leptoderma]|uniref:Uncharacterized protein n=1 Tax=Chaetomidium leptoderma TaxID=669021 RepID=A0AAN6ZT01_9PEZI|nr:hypothetical protein C8A00DRAFT_38451 [Chaetomidium leptoderma]
MCIGRISQCFCDRCVDHPMPGKAVDIEFCQKQQTELTGVLMRSTDKNRAVSSCDKVTFQFVRDPETCRFKESVEQTPAAGLVDLKKPGDTFTPPPPTHPFSGKTVEVKRFLLTPPWIKYFPILAALHPQAKIRVTNRPQGNEIWRDYVEYELDESDIIKAVLVHTEVRNVVAALEHIAVLAPVTTSAEMTEPRFPVWSETTATPYNGRITTLAITTTAPKLPGLPPMSTIAGHPNADFTNFSINYQDTPYTVHSGITQATATGNHSLTESCNKHSPGCPADENRNHMSNLGPSKYPQLLHALRRIGAGTASALVGFPGPRHNYKDAGLPLVPATANSASSASNTTVRPLAPTGRTPLPNSRPPLGAFNKDAAGLHPLGPMASNATVRPRTPIGRTRLPDSRPRNPANIMAAAAARNAALMAAAAAADAARAANGGQWTDEETMKLMMLRSKGVACADMVQYLPGRDAAACEERLASLAEEHGFERDV